jgi:hypothetical protein
MIGHAMALLAVWGMARPDTGTDAGRRTQKTVQLVALGASIAFVVFVVFPAVGRNRAFFSEGITSQNVGEALGVNQTAVDVTHSPGYLACFETTLYFLQLDQPVWGTYYIWYYFFKPIPRLLFPGKGMPDTLASEWFGVERDYNYVGLSAGSIGWSFQQGSWAGLVLEFLLTGYLLRKMEGLRDRSPDKPHVLLAYAGFFSMLPQLGRDSVLVMIEERWLFVYGIPCAMLWWIYRASSRTAAAAGTIHCVMEVSPVLIETSQSTE